MDGYTAIATSNWKRAKYVEAYSYSDKLGPVVILSLVAVNWPKPSNVKCSFGSNLEEDVRNIVSSRFSQQAEEAGEEEE